MLDLVTLGGGEVDSGANGHVDREQDGVVVVAEGHNVTGALESGACGTSTS